MQLVEKLPLATVCTLGIGGPARLYGVARSLEDVQQALQLDSPLLVLGRGSNLLFDDEGFDGLVLQNRIGGVEWSGDQVVAGAGQSWAHLGTVSARKGLSGLEFASGIPGSVGGAVAMNAGANGRETADGLLWVEAVDREGRVRRYRRDELEFGYRSSPFQGSGEVIVRACFEMTPMEGARERQLALLAARKSVQPVSDKSAGCIFRNPVGASAGELIEAAGLKGRRVGGVEVSTLHGNFIVNRGGGTCSEVQQLIGEIREEVERQHGVRLEAEVRYVVPG